MAYPDNVPEWQIKKEICEIGQRIWMKGFCAGNEGNHSVRVGEDRVLCTPTGISKGFLTPDDVCVCDMDGTQIEPNAKGRKRTSEVLVHLSIYKKRDNIKAVVHSHPPHATAFAIAQIPLPEGIHPEAEVFLGRVATAPYATPSTQALPDSITPLIGPETNTVLMGNHGTVSFSHSLIDAFYKLEILDAYSRILLLCHQLGRANVLDPRQMTELLEVKKKFGFDDDRLDCSPEGCVGPEQNAAYLSSFDVRPMTASCECDGGATTTSAQTAAKQGIGHADFETLVQTITDQIIAAMK